MFSDVPSFSTPPQVVLRPVSGTDNSSGHTALPQLVSLATDKTKTEEILLNNSWQESVTDSIIKASTGGKGGTHKRLDFQLTVALKCALSPVRQGAWRRKKESCEDFRYDDVRTKHLTVVNTSQAVTYTLD